MGLRVIIDGEEKLFEGLGGSGASVKLDVGGVTLNTSYGLGGVDHIEIEVTGANTGPEDTAPKED